MMKHVFLFADVGGHADSQYYHVGDEAMLYETYRWYREHHTDWKITIASWFPTHPHLDALETAHLLWPNKHSAFYFPKLCLKLSIFKLFRLSFFSEKERALVQAIQSCDRLHFTGGGNLSSQFRQWLYYCFFVIFAAHTFGKEVILTSQTIGPIHGVDSVFAWIFLNMPTLIAIRAGEKQVRELKKQGIWHPRLCSMLDAAFTLPIKATKTTRDGDYLRVGLSLHAWVGWEDKTRETVCVALTELAKTNTISISLIPHHILSDAQSPDTIFMQHIIATLPGDMKVNNPITSQELLALAVPASYIAQRTADVDVLLTTRYHGIVFALSHNVPVIALQFDAYYRMKNMGALEYMYGSDAQTHMVELDKDNASSQLIEKLKRIAQNPSKAQQDMQKTSSTIRADELSINAVMQTLER